MIGISRYETNWGDAYERHRLYDPYMTILYAGESVAFPEGYFLYRKRRFA